MTVFRARPQLALLAPRNDDRAAPKALTVEIRRSIRSANGGGRNPAAAVL
jgi:hypothetical protein